MGTGSLFSKARCLLCSPESAFSILSSFFYSLLISTPSRTAPCRGSQPLGFQGFFVATAGLLVHVKWMDPLTTRTHVQITGPGKDNFAESGLKSHLFSPLGKKLVVCIHSFAFPPLSLPHPGLCYPGFQGAPSRPSPPAQHRAVIARLGSEDGRGFGSRHYQFPALRPTCRLLNLSEPVPSYVGWDYKIPTSQENLESETRWCS